MNYRILLFMLLIAVIQSVTALNAQIFCINNGLVSTCGGVFQDDNGGTCDGVGNPYSNTNYTFTICPDSPGDVVQVDFAAFQLQTSPNPNNSDYLIIYDGDNTGANQLGSYSGNQLQGLPVTATINNTSGCLTFVFVCNTGNTQSMPGWNAQISCTTPCDNPISAAAIQSPLPNLEGGVLGVCMGDEVVFVDNGSTAGSGFTISEYVWNLGNGQVISGGTQLSHSFDEPGEYLVTLTVLDNNGCASLNLDPMQVLVSTVPVFNTEFDQTVCLGGEAFLNGDPIQSVTWTALPPQVVSGTTYLADGAGFAYNTSLTFDFFEPGATLDDCFDLNSIFVNMEHSYLGDLQIQITCPNGTTVVMVPFPNGGGGTFLGEAVDINNSPTPGIGYDYGWSPSATNGFITSPANWTNTSFINQDGVPWTANIVNPGIYQSSGNLCNLVGCPLNGSWTLTIVDNLAIDDGYVFFWGIDFNPFLYPGVTTFQPIIGMGSDSTWWEGPHITSVSPDGNTIGVTPPSLGDYQYTFFATNNFGCTFDTTITITVVPGPSIDAGPDLLICNDPLQMTPEVSVGGNPADCVFTLNMFDTFGDGWNGCALQIWVNGVLQNTFTLPTGSQGQATFTIPGGQPWQAIFTAGFFINEVYFNIVDQAGVQIVNQPAGSLSNGMVVYSGICAGFGDYVYEWSPSVGLSDPGIPDPFVQVSETTTFTVTVYPQGYPGCASSDEVTVFFDPQGDPGQSVVVDLCFNVGNVNLIDLLGGDPVNTGVWTNPSNAEFNGTISTYTAVSGVYTYTVEHNGCVASATVTVNVLSVNDPLCCEFDFSLVPSNPSCEGYSDGAVTFQMIFSSEGAPWEVELLDGNSQLIDNEVITMTPFHYLGLEAGDYSITVLDAGGCYTQLDFSLIDPLPVLFEVSQDTTICFGGSANLQAFSADDLQNSWVYQWTENAGIGSSVFVNPLVETIYSVTATNNLGCVSQPLEVTVSVYGQLAIETLADTLICIGTDALVGALNPDGGIGQPYSVSWSANGSFVGSEMVFLQQLYGDTEFCVTITDGCETPPFTTCMMVGVEQPPVIGIMTDTTMGCAPLTLSFNHLVDSSLVSSILWTLGSDIQYSFQSFSHTYHTPGTYDIGVQMTSPVGCHYEAFFPAFLTVHPNPVALFHADPQPTYIPETEISFFDYSEGDVIMWQWVFDADNPLGTSAEQNPVFEFPFDVEGVYPISLTVVDVNGCSDEITRFISIYELLGVYIPNAFSPNGDGTNDVFLVKGSDIDPGRFHLEIFNRWGAKVFETKDMNQAWVGNHQGGDYYVPDGVYVYIVEVWSKTTSERKIIRGSVLMTR